MPSYVVPSRFNDVLVSIDQYSDYVPVASSVTNFVDIFEKCVLASCCCSNKTINTNRYYSHLDSKSFLRCLTLLLPIIGNIIIAIVDIKESARKQKFVKGMEKSMTNFEGSLDKTIKALNAISEKLADIVARPEEPLVLGNGKVIEGTHKDKIQAFWNREIAWQLPALDVITLYDTVMAAANLALDLEGMPKIKSRPTIEQKMKQVADLKAKITAEMQSYCSDFVIDKM